jgi:hypothetical protein
VKTLLGTVAAVLALAGCGGTESAPPATPKAATTTSTPAANNPFPDDPQILARTTTASQRRALETLADDIQAMRAASAGAKHTLKGTPATRRATSRFIVHLERSTIDDLSKNRLIDHAAAAVAPTCDQCFQQLEAMRPIPAIAH